MVFLDKIMWDDTLAGPPPETELRKYHSFSFPSSGVGGSRPDSNIDRNAQPSLGGMKRLVAEKIMGNEDVSPIVCNWIVISALDA